MLTVIWNRGEVSRLGECLIIPIGARGQTRVFGRGADHSSDPFPRVHLVRYRATETLPAVLLDNAHISRVQVLLRTIDSERLEIENVGLCELFHNGSPTSKVELRSGDTIRLGRQLAFVVTRRSLSALASSADYDEFPFGAADGQGIVGESVPIWKLRFDVEFVASRSGHVLIHGPSGTGKELVAQAIHRLSRNVTRPLVSRNAATIPDSLVDAELFGNARNYPNAGMPDRPGLIGEAHQSTLFLDEFAELPAASRTHLLRVMDHGEYQRLGQTRLRHSVFRLIAATNRPLNTLKEDILARFSFRICTSPLNDRREDVPLLLRHFLHTAAAADPLVSQLIDLRRTGVSPELLETLVRHHYTAGYRELTSLVWQALSSNWCGNLDTGGTGLRAQTEPLANSPTIPNPRLGAGHVCSEGDPEAKPEAAPIRSQIHGSISPEVVQACLDLHNGVLEKVWRAMGLKNRHVLARLITKHGLEVRRKPTNRPGGTY